MSGEFRIEPRLLLLKKLCNELESATFDVNPSDMAEGHKILDDLRKSMNRSRMLLWKMQKLVKK